MHDVALLHWHDGKQTDNSIYQYCGFISINLTRPRTSIMRKVELPQTLHYAMHTVHYLRLYRVTIPSLPKSIFFIHNLYDIHSTLVLLWRGIALSGSAMEIYIIVDLYCLRWCATCRTECKTSTPVLYMSHSIQLGILVKFKCRGRMEKAPCI